MTTRPTPSERLFLNLAYNRFYDLASEIIEDAFWEKKGRYRFSKISNLFSVYTELLTYESFNFVLEAIKTERPPMESEIGRHLFKVIRNIFVHFPVFETWNDVWVSKELINWQNDGLTIDRFFKKFSGHKEVKYRFWETNKKLMTYISLNFPIQYDDNKIYLKDILSEKDGVKFSLIMMKKILDTQIESIKAKYQASKE